jgi:hypothetical protein
MTSTTTIVIDGTTYAATMDGVQAAHDALPSSGGRIYIPRNTTITNSGTTHPGLRVTKPNVTIEGEDPETSVIHNSQPYATCISVRNYASYTVGTASDLSSDRQSFTLELTNSQFYTISFTPGCYFYLQSESGHELVVVDRIEEGYRVHLKAPIYHIPRGVITVIFNVAPLTDNIQVKNLKFQSSRAHVDSSAVVMEWCQNCTISNCQMLEFEKSAVALYLGYNTTMDRVSTRDCGNGGGGACTLYLQVNLTLNQHVSHGDYFSVVMSACMGSQSDSITVRCSKLIGTAGRALKLISSYYCKFGVVDLYDSEDVALLFDGGTVGCSFGRVTIVGGDMQLDYAGGTETPVLSNTIEVAVLMDAVTRGIWADAQTGGNYVRTLITSGGNSSIVEDGGLGNSFSV